MRYIFCSLLFVYSILVQAQDQHFQPTDIFDLENISDPQISPDGEKVIYARVFRDIMTDRTLSNLWIVNFDGSEHRPLTSGNQNDFSPEWLPSGDRVIYKSNRDGSTQLYMRWLDTGAEAKLTNLTESPGALTVSPDGKWIAMTKFVPAQSKKLAQMPSKPEGAEWAEPAIYIEDMNYRADGRGYVKQGYTQLFVLSTDGGTPRQLTFSDYDHGAPVWGNDNKTLYFSANLREGGEYDPQNTEIYRIQIESGTVTPLTDRQGPDTNPQVSPDGKMIAYTGYDDRLQGYQMPLLYVMNIDGTGSREVETGLDRRITNIHWDGDGKGIYFQYQTEGDVRIGYTTLNGKVRDIVTNAGGAGVSRPYSGGQYSVSENGRIAFTHGSPMHPADLATRSESGPVTRITRLNDDLFAYRTPGEVEEIWYESSHDGRKIQGWIIKPPDFDPSKKYPLILEIHGGPFLAYGPWFTMELQLYAAAGYVVLYTNPRGSASYGEEFGNLIHHNYPGEDFDDLMSGVDAVIEKGYINQDELYVTGGSGGGILSAWIVSHTDRFAAAVVAKPVINWYSFVLYADGPAFFYKYWFPGYPWDHLEHYMERSPIYYVQNVTTPTMLLTGENDYRTPIAESEQFYAALKLNKVESAMVRIPGASHGIAARPSNQIAKVVNILAWFDKHK